MKNKIRNSFFIFCRAILFAGIINILVGEFYTLFVAGLPYQDPPLELQIQYSINQGVGNVLTGIGFKMVILGIILSIISKVSRIIKNKICITLCMLICITSTITGCSVNVDEEQLMELKDFIVSYSDSHSDSESKTDLKTIKVNGKEYATGFYGDMFINKYKLSGRTFKVGKTEYRSIKNVPFDLIHADVGLDASGTIYCEISQYEEAQEFYSNSNNYEYFCEVGCAYLDENKNNIEPTIYEVTDIIDREKTDELIIFADENTYSPFNSIKNKDVDTVEYPFIPTPKEYPEISFYKQSTDGLFTSCKGYDFRIIDGELVKIFYRDRGFGEYEKTFVVRLPEELNDYFLDFLADFEELK